MSATNPKFGKKPLEYYTDSDRGDHEIALQILYDCLKGRDYEDRISGKELAEKVPVKKTTVYDLLQELRNDWGLPVYSRQGYFEVQSQEMLGEIVDQINETIETKERTKQNLARNVNRRHL